MAKKIFCGVCGNEMRYEEIQLHLKAESVEVNVVGDGNKKLKFEVAVRITAKNYNGGRIDVCQSCWHFVLDKLDARSDDERENSLSDARASRQV